MAKKRKPSKGKITLSPAQCEQVAQAIMRHTKAVQDGVITGLDAIRKAGRFLCSLL